MAFLNNIRSVSSLLFPQFRTLHLIRTLRTDSTFDKYKMSSEMENQSVPAVISLYRRKLNKNNEVLNKSPIERLCPQRSFAKSAMYQSLDTLELNGSYFSRGSLNFVGGVKNPDLVFANWQLYVSTKGPGPGPVKQSGGGIGKLDATGEAGFFHKVNLSKLKQLKAMLGKKLHRKPEGKTEDEKK